MQSNDAENPSQSDHEQRLTKLENTVDALIERQGSFMDRYNARQTEIARQAEIAREPELSRAMRALEDMGRDAAKAFEETFTPKF